MKELWLIFREPGGEERRVRVEGARFTIGRHSESDLCIVDSCLSREHARIERSGEEFLIADLGSSNGTTLNGVALTSERILRDGDEIVLGGSVRVKIEISAVQAEAISEGVQPEFTAESGIPEPGHEQPALNAPAPVAAAQYPADSRSIPPSVLFIAPALGVLVLVLIGGFIYFFGGSRQPVVASDNEFEYSQDIDEDPPIKSKETRRKADPDPAPTPAPVNTSEVGSSTPDTPTNSPGPPKDPSETAKIEQNGAAFLRRVAQNDPRAFLTTDQAKRVSVKVKQLSGSSALADNINSARKNAAQIRSIAAAKNLKPQFLAVAAIAKLGSSRGDVVRTAAAMADVLDKLSIQVYNESGEDALLMIAAYDQGAAGDFRKMRDMLQDLANKFPESSRAIRSVWFLEKNGKITPSEFDAALTFLAVGIITQNPKDFGVNAEALSL